MRPLPRRLVATASAMALSAGLLSFSTAPTTEATPQVTEVTPKVAAAAKKASTTSKKEKRRSKAVKTPKLSWYSCYTTAKCTTVKVPLDYDKPKGKKVTLAVLKTPAKNQKKKLGTLFVNPGGPGGSATEMAYFADSFLSAEVLERFDVVGIDPRGVAFSKNVKCFSSARKNEPGLSKINSMAFPYTTKEEKAMIKAYSKHAKGCSTTGKPLSGAMSTAQVARDMDLLRRAVGDKKLTYLGFSYGSYLGEVYANLYPDRVRALAIDGVLDPVRWAGTKKTAKTPIGARLLSAEGADRALKQALVLCDRAGPTRCAFADGNPVANFATIAKRLRSAPLVEIDPDTGERFTLTYADFIGMNLSILYSQEYGPEFLTEIAADFYELTDPASGAAKNADVRKQTVRSLIKLEKAAKKAQQRPRVPGRSYGFPYDNSIDAFMTIGCTDSRNSKNLSKFGALADAADKRAPYFGRLWLWNLAGCSSPKWKVKDEDAYRGPFTKRTSTPVLIVGNYWDPATAYAGAVSTSKRMPNSRLLSSNSWGHTAYNTSECVTGAIDTYLLTRKVPAAGKTCNGDYVPFEEELESESTRKSAKTPKAPVAIAPTRPGLR